MSINLIIPMSLLKITKEKNTIEVHGKTIGQCLVDLVKQYPDFEEQLFYGGREEFLAVEGKLWSKIEILLNGKLIKNNILTTVVQSNDKLEIKINTK
ncbi:MAG: MoaD/ThiS family protein [Dehalococcoidales bacterium]|nr:MAG: MoaD/ThiS family protein [Dehalococcoidales bacterium]